MLAQCTVASAVLALLTIGGFELHINLLTISLLYLLIVVAVASLFGFWQASFASVIAVLLLDYFFEPPLFSFEVENPGIFVALVTFEATALTISRMHGREMRRAREAAIHLKGMEQLYELSRSTLLLDLRRPSGPQLAVLIQRIFDVRAVALFDMSLGRQDRVGEWAAGEEDLAKECYLHGAAQDDPQTQTARRLLHTGAGSGPVGALAVRGKLNPLVVDALAALAAIAIDRHQSFEKEERAETAKQSEQLRAAVLDALAHELKTPLTAVQTASSGLLELGGLTDSQTELVTLIDGEAVRLNELCTRLLVTAKLDRKQVGLDLADVNVKELIFEVLADRPKSLGRDRIQVVVDDPDLVVDANRKLLAMILAQYIDNARKYSMPDTPIEVAARRSHSDVLLSVHNFGSTIRIEDRERVFDRFYRSSDQKGAVPGTGIGLSVVKKAADAHHGHVWVISDDREGTTFFLSLPMGARRKQ
ncbi:MAG: ATP-binding protein [Terracidiphilus sp.]|jgi:two-component system sensor histidine kinase KdpD